ncbi:pyrroline-5-carboxylate reductase [Flavobacterium silvaticum]|uniref:Pyrroline-5-carboxylate reductase n=1 Tax=Flavobacterium silvaticum TaxID=1852020 RepID=A0A972FKU9_9FLAO|nr:pyrroline-5-carboxylate reductase [Flavobacterium silvaticum]NMH27879.1 pyrroline-5-carboxylate reductase [Flavobacterium silvaticum]
MKIAILGYGNMGKTYAQSFINSGVVKPADVFVLCKRPPLIINNTIPFENFSTNSSEVIPNADVIILSVKPQDFPELAKSISGKFNDNQLVLSVMAGVKMASIALSTGASKIVRSMPNVASQIGMGMTVFSASGNIGMENLMIVQNLLNTTGKSLYVSDEDKIDAATAVSGSGPAYVFYFMEAMMQAAQKLGFTESEAETLVGQTFMGAINLQNGSSLNGRELIAKVASKGGTTERALAVMDNASVTEIVSKAINAANQRARELGS